MPFATIEEIKSANAALGQTWFGPDEMRFFNSKIESAAVIGDRYFITSERAPQDTERKYTIRAANDNGTIRNVGEFQQFESKARAAHVARVIARYVHSEDVDFACWMADVDTVVRRKCGLSVFDLPDMAFYDAFEGQEDPKDVAETLLEEEGFPFDD